MAGDRTITMGRRRGRGVQALALSEPLELLKALRDGGHRLCGGGFQIKLENPIYDTVPEDEYDALVAKLREESRGFIVDEGESERPKRKKSEKKDPQPNKSSSSLSAAATMIGAERLSSMFTSSVFKESRNDKVKGPSCDSIVDDVIAEFAPDETDRQRRRRQVNSISGTTNIVPNDNVKSEKPRTNLLYSSLLPDVGAGNNLESARVLKDDGCALDLEQNFESTRENTFFKESEDGQFVDSENGQPSVMQFVK
ncbi:hypothetical protein L6164_019900 [Bauhinia variegata]|uniref:Uncharacterized protein n=1 Tax=Bauhinia variegata TaxID=167791 RepID=A0ACB9MY22_BAUVA|nr:hypothetical protein L6164_019900 [Bauhinia variegata]